MPFNFFFRGKNRPIVIETARLLNYEIQKAVREQTEEQAAAQRSEQEQAALARRDAGKQKAAATKKRKAEEAEKAAEEAREAQEALKALKAARKEQNKEEKKQRQRRKKVEARKKRKTAAKTEKRRAQKEARVVGAFISSSLGPATVHGALFLQMRIDSVEEQMPTFKLTHRSKRMLFLFHAILDLYMMEWFSSLTREVERKKYDYPGPPRRRSCCGSYKDSGGEQTGAGAEAPRETSSPQSNS